MAMKKALYAQKGDDGGREGTTKGDGHSDRFPAWLCPWSALRSCSRHVLVRNRKPAVFSLLVKVRCPWSCSLLTEAPLDVSNTWSPSAESMAFILGPDIGHSPTQKRLV